MHEKMACIGHWSADMSALERRHVGSLASANPDRRDRRRRHIYLNLSYTGVSIVRPPYSVSSERHRDTQSIM